MTVTSRETIGGYEVLSRLSSGGMGEVLLARRRGAHGFEKIVALKVIRPELRRREDLRSMFLDEARLVAQIGHPNVAQVYDFGEENDILFLAMEYVAGVSFGELRDKYGALPPGIAVRAAAEVCRGLHAAHEIKDAQGQHLCVVHRDVSPQNLFLTFEGRVKILDFGIAFMKDRVTPQTEFGQVKGKPGYMAPEQLAAGDIDRRTDLFSLSVVLYELLTGKRLFQGASVFETVAAMKDRVIEPPSTITGPLPEALDSLVMQGLERDINKRPPDAMAMAGLLDRAAEAFEPETLEAFAERALTRERDRHQEQLRAVLDTPTPVGLTPAGSVGRPPQVQTVQEATPVEMATAPAGRPRRAPRRRLVWVAGVAVSLVASAFGALVVWQMRRAPRPMATELATGQRSLPATVPPPVTRPLPAPQPPAPAVEDPPGSRPAPRPRGKARKSKAAGPTAGASEPRPAVAASDVGYLRVAADPYALVRIDGRMVGTTPLVKHELAVGSHKLELVNPDNGTVRYETAVTVRKDALTTISHP
ncbi:MAG: serine/threonine protein kinase [Deltaproteobacteria bacterium]|nr:serine/threonine protein kinase [Deltaproteobacteria bacterium]